MTYDTVPVFNARVVVPRVVRPEFGGDMSQGFVVSRAGRLRYQRFGAGESVFLMHGNGQSAWSWESVAPGLASSFDVIAWDMPGQGDSEQVSGHLTIDDYADCAVDVLDAFGVQQATFVGSSIGGQICASLGARHPSRVASLVFVEANFRPEAWWIQSWQRIESRFAIPVQDMDVLEERFRRPDAALLQRWNVDRSKAGGGVMMSAMWAIREFDMDTALRQVQHRSLVVFGADGPSISATDEFLDALPTAVVRVMENSGHFPMNDEPDELVAAIRDFLQPSNSQGAADVAATVEQRNGS